jgi:L-lactate dehydrogenase (cytochrome)
LSPVILRYAGADATAAYNSIHAPSVITSTLPSSAHLGTVDPSTIPAAAKSTQFAVTTTPRPPLSTLLSLHDIAAAASQFLSPKSWAFYSSAATDLLTLQANKRIYDKVMLRPRVLRDVRKLNTQTTILGCEISIPIFVAPASLVKLAHPEGERVIARGASSTGIIQCISTAAGFAIHPTLSHSIHNLY